MERDDVRFCEGLATKGFKCIKIGTEPEESEYQFTARKVGEVITSKSDISLKDALAAKR